VKAQYEAVGLGSFFKHRSYDYTNEELNLSQGHTDRIHSINLTPKDQTRLEDTGDDSVLPTDWLECTAEIHPSLDLTFGSRIWRRLAIGDLMTQYGSIYNNTERQFGNRRVKRSFAYNAETNKKVKALQAINAKCNLPPNTGVEQLKNERAGEFKTYLANLLTRFKAKSSCWTTPNRE
jgi:hypothetical protein